MTHQDPDYRMGITETGSRVHCVEFGADSFVAKAHGTSTVSVCLMYRQFQEVDTKEGLLNHRFCKTCKQRIEKGEFDGAESKWQKYLEFDNQLGERK